MITLLRTTAIAGVTLGAVIVDAPLVVQAAFGTALVLNAVHVWFEADYDA